MLGKIVRPWPFAMDSAFAIRDDDVSYFTDPSMVKQLYSRAFEKGFKVSFAVIPNHKTSSNPNVPPFLRRKRQYFAVSGNEELVEYIKRGIKDGMIDVLQHGYAHTENPHFNLSEFYGLNYRETLERVVKGKMILERTFGKRVDVHVAPQEYLTPPLAKAVGENYPFYCGGVRKIPVLYLLRMLCCAGFRPWRGVRALEDAGVSNRPMHLIPSYRHYWNKFENEAEADHWLSKVNRLILRKLRQKGYFILLTHYWEYFHDWSGEVTRKRQFEYLNRILESADNLPHIWKCTITELANWLRALKSIVVIKKDSEFIVYSPYDLDGLTVSSDEINIKHLDEQKVRIRKRIGNRNIVLTMRASQRIRLPRK